MDDIDRLDKREIQAVFKLVKLSADFPFVTYVLAFDEQMVASALQEAYPGTKESGHNFLEKIVQVPLNLPKADRLSLRKLCFEGVDEAIKSSELQLAEADVQRFVRHFIDGLEIRLENPRIGKRYCNAILFALPILKGEINPVDLMLIEGIRVFYPPLYEKIRRHQDVFLTSGDRDPLRLNEDKKKWAEKVINEGLTEFTEEAQTAAKELLVELFPNLSSLLRNVHFGSDWEEEWTKNKRVCSKNYFGRYFSYSIPQGDIADSEIDELVDMTNSKKPDEIADRIGQTVDPSNAECFMLKLRMREKTLSPEQSKSFIETLILKGGEFPNPGTLFSFTTPFSQAGIFVAQLLKNIPEGQARMTIATKIVNECKSPSFTLECLRWIRSSNSKAHKSRTLTAEEEDQLGKQFAERIKRLSEKEVLYIKFPKDGLYFLSVWARHTSREETAGYLKKCFDEDEAALIELIKEYLPTGWGIDSGIPQKGDFERDQYDALAKIADTEDINKRFEKKYGDALLEKLSESGKTPVELRVARQFARIHRFVKDEAATKQGETKALPG